MSKARVPPCHQWGACPGRSTRASLRHGSPLDEDSWLRATGGHLNEGSLTEAFWVGVRVKNVLESEMESSRI